MYHFCTYFDSNYLLRGLTLYRSLVATGCSFKLHVLALDDQALALIGRLHLPNLEAFGLCDLEAWAPSLLRVKAERSLIEYYFTITPQVPLFFLDRHLDINLITCLDADLYFYSSPEALFDELGTASVLITPHRYPESLKSHEMYGLYNVQFQSFRRDDTGLACLNRWRDQCLEWCYDRIEDGKYADQKYLDEWPERYGDGLVVAENPGCGVAPWNWSSYPMELEGDNMTIGGCPLVFYHFHGLKVFHKYFISNGLLDWGLMPRPLMRWLYVGYVREMMKTRLWLLDTTGIDFVLKDRFIRGGGRGVAALPEIIRKAWAQGTFVCY